MIHSPLTSLYSGEKYVIRKGNGGGRGVIRTQGRNTRYHRYVGNWDEKGINAKSEMLVIRRTFELGCRMCVGVEVELPGSAVVGSETCWVLIQNENILPIVAAGH